MPFGCPSCPPSLWLIALSVITLGMCAYGFYLSTRTQRRYTGKLGVSLRCYRRGTHALGVVQSAERGWDNAVWVSILPAVSLALGAVGHNPRDVRLRVLFINAHTTAL